MHRVYDSIIIGAGISGAAISYELAKKGYQTLNLDKLTAAGHGSTSNTCAIIRTHYSTLEGTAIAFDSYFAWKEWDDYIGVEDEKGVAKFNQIGLINIHHRGQNPDKYTKLHYALGIPYEIWDPQKLLSVMPHFVDDSFYPPKRPEDTSFGDPPAGKILEKILFTIPSDISVVWNRGND